MNTVYSLSAPAGRSLPSLIFIVSGFGKITAYSGTQAYMDSMGVPGALLPAVIILEVLGGLAITLAYAPILAAIWRFSAEAAPGERARVLVHEPQGRIAGLAIEPLALDLDPQLGLGEDRRGHDERTNTAIEPGTGLDGLNQAADAAR